jgi:hypothetical protein
VLCNPACFDYSRPVNVHNDLKHMSETLAARLESPNISYFSGVVLVLMAGAFWSSMGLGIRMIEQANVWQILFYRSIALATFLFCIITIRSGYKPLRAIRSAGLAGAIGGVGLVFAFAGGIYAIQTTTVANAMFLFAAAPFLAAVAGWIILRSWWLMVLPPVRWPATSVRCCLQPALPYFPLHCAGASSKTCCRQYSWAASLPS